MHNVYKGGEWAAGAADDGRYDPGLQPTGAGGEAAKYLVPARTDLVKSFKCGWIERSFEVDIPVI